MVSGRVRTPLIFVARESKIQLPYDRDHKRQRDQKTIYGVHKSLYNGRLVNIIITLVLYNDTLSNAIVNAASHISYRSMILQLFL